MVEDMITKLPRLLMAVGFFMMILISCNDATKEIETSNSDSLVKDKTDNISTSSGKTCYAYLTAKDTVTLTLLKTGENVEGRLVFRLSEKDANTGELKGKIENGLLVSYYTFQSEGMTSVREEVFKMEGKDLIRGYGEVVTGNDTVRFANRSALQYENSIRLSPVNCIEK